MNGIKINGVSLFVGDIPPRKQACFYFVEGERIYPVAYIRKEQLAKATRLWNKMVEELPWERGE